MILTRLSLTNFRSYKKAVFSLSPYTTLIVGANASGKTNIIEAVAMLATGKSFRADTDRDTMRWGEDLTRIRGEGGDTTLELMITTGMVSGKSAPAKKYLVRGVARRTIDFVGNLHAVLFWPEDLELVTDSPSLRRKYLDRVLVQVDREYRRNLYSFERGLRQRNRLLDLIAEGRGGRNQLLFWNQLLIKAGGYITDARDAYLTFINGYAMTGCDYKVEYDKSVISESRLEQYKDEEIAAGATLVGPHRDDFHFYSRKGLHKKNNKKEYVSLTSFGSRGEQRLGVLWLKLAELSFITEKSGNRPILLLDDIFSELDEEHRKLILSIISMQQTIITSAEDDVKNLLKHTGITYEVIPLPEV